MSEPNSSGNWRTQTPGCTPQTGPPVADLGVQEPHLAELYRILARCVGTYQSVALSPQDAATLLQHVDAQATQLAALETENGALRARLRAAEGRAWYEVDDGA